MDTRMYCGVTFFVEIILFVALISAAPPTTSLPVNESVNNDTKPNIESFTEDVPINGHTLTPIDDSTNSDTNDAATLTEDFPITIDLYTEVTDDSTEWPQKPFDCEKSELSWRCPGWTEDGRIPLDISFDNELRIKCSENITCAQMPDLKEKIIPNQLLRIAWCPALSASCVLKSGAVPASELRYLSLDDASLDGLEEFVGLKDLTLLGYGAESSEPWVVPTQSLANMTSLIRLQIRRGRTIVPSEGFTALSSLERLELASLSSIELPKKPFASLDKLKLLGLWSNKFTELDKDIFYGLKALKSLNLNANYLSRIPKESLAQVPSITELTIMSNYISNIRAGDFEGLTNLTSLNISDNRKDLVISEGAFSELTALKSLYLRGSRVIEIAAMGAPALLDLNLSGNRLRSLPSDVFRYAPSLNTLILDSNKLEELPRDMLKIQTSLVTLSICNNQLRNVKSSALDGARNSLKTLRLRNNNITFSDDYSYQDLRSPLEHLIYLSELDLSHNAIADVYNDWLFVLLQLQSLNLSYNRIDILMLDEIKFLQETITVDLRHNNISSIITAAAAFAVEGGEGGDERATERTLLLGGNPLQCDCRLHAALRLPRAPASPAAALTLRAPHARLELSGAVCAAPTELRGVALDRLPPRELQCALPGCPRACRCLQRPDDLAIEVECGVWPPDGDLPDLPSNDYEYEIRVGSVLAADAALANLFALPNRTRALDCSGLALAEVPTSNSTPRESLRSIDLRDNVLSSVPELALAEGGPRVLLAGNPLRCDCEHGAALQRLEARRWRVDYDALRCAGGGAVAAVGGAAALCLARDAMVAGGALAALALLLAAGALLLWRYWLEVRVWLAARGLLPGWVDADDLDCDYDAFVSYSHLDEKFVSEELVPALEGARRPRRLCLHSRDWLCGASIPANVAASVERSRRTLVVLSRNFLGSLWGQHEVTTALGGRRRVVVLLLEDVAGDARLGRELAAHVATHTYLRRDDPAFWSRLLRAVPPGARRLPAKAA